MMRLWSDYFGTWRFPFSSSFSLVRYYSDWVAENATVASDSRKAKRKVVRWCCFVTKLYAPSHSSPQHQLPYASQFQTSPSQRFNLNVIMHLTCFSRPGVFWFHLFGLLKNALKGRRLQTETTETQTKKKTKNQMLLRRLRTAEISPPRRKNIKLNPSNMTLLEDAVMRFRRSGGRLYTFSVLVSASSTVKSAISLWVIPLFPAMHYLSASCSLWVYRLSEQKFERK